MTDTMWLDGRLAHEMKIVENRAIRHDALDRGAAAGFSSAAVAAGAEMVLEGLLQAVRRVRARSNRSPRRKAR